MKKAKFFPIFLILCLTLALFAPAPARADSAPPLYSFEAIVLDRQTGRIIFEKNPDVKLYPASLTKIMTVLLAVEAVERNDVSLDDAVTASSNITFDLSALGSTANIAVGETMRLEDLIYCAMLSSANEACNIIAEHVSGTISAFVERMNERAEALGCTATRFANTHGLTDSNHYTTARDMALIALEASRHSLFMKYCGAGEYTVPATNRSGERALHNSNALLSAQSMYGSQYLYDGISGMKTGHTSYAGYCLASTAERDGRSLLCLTFGSETSDGCFVDSTRLLNWAFETYRPEELPAIELLVSTTTPAASVIPDTDGPEIESAAAVVMNRENGDIFFSRNGGARVYPADTVKLMTALLAVEAVESGAVSLRSDVTVSASADYDLPQDANRMLTTGEVLTLEDLLYLILLSSADDACNVVAEYVGGSTANYIDRMNDRAHALGCMDTQFANPHGQFDPACWSTPADMGLIALETTRHDILTRICGAATAEIPETNLSPARSLQNTNALLGASSYAGTYTYERASGLKSGYNTAAGYCLVSSAGDPDSGVNLVAAVFGGVSGENGFTHYTDTIALYDYIFSNYSYQEVLSPNNNIASVDVHLGRDADYVNLRPAGAISLLLPNGYDPNDFTLDLQVYSLQQGQAVTAPVTAGEVLGEVSVLRDGQNCGTVKLIAASNVELSRTQYIRTHISETTHTTAFRIIFFGVLALIALYLAWVILYRVRRLRYRKAVRTEARAAAEEFTPAAPYVPEPARPAPAIEYFPEEADPAPAEPEAVREDLVDVQDLRSAEAGALPRTPADSLPEAVPADPEVLRNLASGLAPSPGAEPEEVPAPPPAAPKESSRMLPDPFADIDLTLFDNKDDRDYFEEFFRRK